MGRSSLPPVPRAARPFLPRAVHCASASLPTPSHLSRCRSVVPVHSWPTLYSHHGHLTYAGLCSLFSTSRVPCPVLNKRRTPRSQPVSYLAARLVSCCVMAVVRLFPEEHGVTSAIREAGTCSLKRLLYSSVEEHCSGLVHTHTHKHHMPAGSLTHASIRYPSMTPVCQQRRLLKGHVLGRGRPILF